MRVYIVKRLLLIVPTLLAIMAVNFFIVQTAPGGPVEQAVANLMGHQGGDVLGRIAKTGKETLSSDRATRGSRGLPAEFIEELEKRYGFDKPLHERFFRMLWQYMRLDFGESFFRDRKVFDLVMEKMPVSISLGLWSTLLVYLISVPLGVSKAVRDGAPFDVWTSFVLAIGTAIPSFLLAVFLLVVFAGGSFLDWFPLRGLTSSNWEELTWGGRILDYLWHLVLPVTAMTVGGFSTLAMLTKNAFLDQLHQQYVMVARAKGLHERKVLYGHVFRNAMLVVIAGFPAAFISILFTSSVLIETIFSLDGLGLLGFEAAFQRDYPVMFGTLYVFSLLGLFLGIIGDVVYTLVDPRIDFASRDG